MHQQQSIPLLCLINVIYYFHTVLSQYSKAWLLWDVLQYASTTDGIYRSNKSTELAVWVTCSWNARKCSYRWVSWCEGFCNVKLAYTVDISCFSYDTYDLCLMAGETVITRIIRVVSERYTIFPYFIYFPSCACAKCTDRIKCIVSKHLFL